MFTMFPSVSLGLLAILAAGYTLQEESFSSTVDLWQSELLKHNITPPRTATQYDGIEWPSMSFLEDGNEVHVFAIGDWGSMLPLHLTAPNQRGARKCPDCDYVQGLDDKAQILVADQMKLRAKRGPPHYILNVGDNFYLAGLEHDCGNMQPAGRTLVAFASSWHWVYQELADIPWLSVLGNHDYGGWIFHHAWDQQIGYSFIDRNWVMPARYYSRTMRHRNFSIEFFMLDSNHYDAGDKEYNQNHNLCGLHNALDANCSSIGGPASVAECHHWFWTNAGKQQTWMERKLRKSRADWQVVVTHFPCGHNVEWYRKLRKMGLDLLVTGHRHNQELWIDNDDLGGLPCFVTGGGGGITSEKAPRGNDTDQYGFFDLTISKTTLLIESVNIYGNVINSTQIYPKR